MSFMSVFKFGSGNPFEEEYRKSPALSVGYLHCFEQMLMLNKSHDIA